MCLSSYPAAFVEETIISLWNSLGTFVENQTKFWEMWRKDPGMKIGSWGELDLMRSTDTWEDRLCWSASMWPRRKCWTPGGTQLNRDTFSSLSLRNTAFPGEKTGVTFYLLVHHRPTTAETSASAVSLTVSLCLTHLHRLIKTSGADKAKSEQRNGLRQPSGQKRINSNQNTQNWVSVYSRNC